ncbi:MAG: ribulose-phosphate 3-epimerase [Candidatus Gracilibacteria bacterium]
MANKIQISPSILSADFGQLNLDIASIEPYADSLHVDVMDGHFVPNLSFGAPVIRWIKTSLPLECHLMVENPEQYFEAFVKAGAHSIIVHAETVKDLPACFEKLRDLGVEVGVSINPETPIFAILSVLSQVDTVLLMSVHPGFGGQEFIPEVLDKIRLIRADYPDLDIAVDGGVNAQTAPAIIEAGANILISGSYIFGAPEREEAIKKLRGEG